FDWAILLPVAGGFFYATSAIATRALCEGESTLSLLFGTMATLGIFGALGSLWFWAYPIPAEATDFLTRGWVTDMTPVIWMIAAQAVVSVGGVFLIIRAYQIGEASYVAVFEYSVMIFGPLFAWLAFGRGLGPAQMIGIVMIAAAGAIIALRSRSGSVTA
ncbi:MAG: EamA family transporter, partial [Arenibacterium sp.]